MLVSAGPYPRLLMKTSSTRGSSPNQPTSWIGQSHNPNGNNIHRELRRKGVTQRLLWLEYRESHPDGYSYSRFCELYRLWAKKLDPTMQLTHKAEEKVFVTTLAKRCASLIRKLAKSRRPISSSQLRIPATTQMLKRIGQKIYLTGS